MSAAVADALPFRRREPALGPALGLSVVMHVVLILILFFGVRFQSSPPAQVMVELWEPPPPPAPVVVEKPPPPPVVKPEPEPEVKKPDIALAEKPKPVPPKRDLAFEKQLKAEAMAEAKMLEEQRRRIDEQNRERERKETLARLQADARNKALATWTDKIRARIRGFIILPQDIPGNPEAIFDVTILPTGEVLTVRKRKSSGHAGYDDAVERAIMKSSPLPKPDDPALFQRQLELKFRPQDR